MEAIRDLRPQKGLMRLRILPPGLRIRELVGIRCLRTAQAATTLALVLEPSLFNNGDENTATGVAAFEQYDWSR